MKNLKNLLTVSLLSVSVFGLIPNIAKASQSAVGTLAKQNGTVYMVLETFRRPYSSAAAFLSYSFNLWDHVVDPSKEDVALPINEAIPPREGSVICSDQITDKGTCYLISDSKKLKISSAEVFKQLGFDFKNAIVGDISFVVAGPDITSGSIAHPVGTLIKKSGTIYIVGKNGLIGIPNLTILNSWGYELKDAVAANAEDLKLEYKFSAENRYANELRPYEPIIPAALTLSNEDKFSIPFEKNTSLNLSESWLYSSGEKLIHGFTLHGAADFDQKRGTPVYAAADGYAISSTQIAPQNRNFDGKQVGFGLGNFVQIWHPKQGVYTSYGHLWEIADNIKYFKPNCENGACSPDVIYNDTDYSVQNGTPVKRGDLIGYIGDTGLSWGYKETPLTQRDVVNEPSWDDTHLHFEVYTRVAPNFVKSKRYDPFGIYGRADQYNSASFVNPLSLWKLNSDNSLNFSK